MVVRQVFLTEDVLCFANEGEEELVDSIPLLCILKVEIGERFFSAKIQ